jgi:hypothetical protein
MARAPYSETLFLVPCCVICDVVKGVEGLTTLHAQLEMFGGSLCFVTRSRGRYCTISTQDMCASDGSLKACKLVFTTSRRFALGGCFAEQTYGCIYKRARTTDCTCSHQVRDRSIHKLRVIRTMSVYGTVFRFSLPNFARFKMHHCFYFDRSTAVHILMYAEPF